MANTMTVTTSPKTTTFQFRINPEIRRQAEKAFKFQQTVAQLITEIEKGEDSIADSGWINEGDVLAKFS